MSFFREKKVGFRGLESSPFYRPRNPQKFSTRWAATSYITPISRVFSPQLPIDFRPFIGVPISPSTTSRRGPAWWDFIGHTCVFGKIYVDWSLHLFLRLCKKRKKPLEQKQTHVLLKEVHLPFVPRFLFKDRQKIGKICVTNIWIIYGKLSPKSSWNSSPPIITCSVANPPTKNTTDNFYHPEN